MSTVGRKSNRERIHQEIEIEKKEPTSRIDFGLEIQLVGWLWIWLRPFIVYAVVLHNKLMKQQDI